MKDYNEKQRELVNIFSCSVADIKYDSQEEINGATKFLETLLSYYSNKK